MCFWLKVSKIMLKNEVAKLTFTLVNTKKITYFDKYKLNKKIKNKEFRDFLRVSLTQKNFFVD